MKCKFSAIAIALFVASLLGCKDDTLILPMPTANTYIAYDSAGTLVVQGTMLINVKDSTITGSWRLSKIGNAQNIGPQTGNGTLKGIIHDGTYYIDLNPGWADNNVLLAGKIENKILHGSWTWSTFAGPTNGGTFEARPTGIIQRQQ
jgi:hypothetical protein